MDLRTSLLLGVSAFIRSDLCKTNILRLYFMRKSDDSIRLLLLLLSFSLLSSLKPGGGGFADFSFSRVPRTFSESSKRHHQQSSGHGAG